MGKKIASTEGKKEKEKERHKKSFILVDWELTEEDFQDTDFQIPQVLKTNIWKRFFDISLSLTAMIFFLPIATLFAIAIILEDGSPIFYAQKRVGKGGKLFYIFKFRSMVMKADKFGDLGGERGQDWRITRIGYFMRNTALDELPNLWNIFIGEMSFVGPRAERPVHHRQHCKNIPGFENRLKVTPGLVCLAALCNTDAPDWTTEMRREKAFDLLYIRKYSFWFDLLLIFAGLKTTLFFDWGTEKRKI